VPRRRGSRLASRREGAVQALVTFEHPEVDRALATIARAEADPVKLGRRPWAAEALAARRGQRGQR
jgi:hypothetical protein